VPELPDVEGFRRTFARHAVGKRVRGVHGVDRGLLRSSTPAGLGDQQGQGSERLRTQLAGEDGAAWHP
jgi:formamidopyrimidine-DNA glycosylase